MNGRELVKRRLYIAEAFADGRTVQFKKTGENDDRYIDYRDKGLEPCFFSQLLDWREKPEPREFWVEVGSFGTVINNFGWLHPEDNLKSEKGGSIEVIKVREVLDD